MNWNQYYQSNENPNIILLKNGVKGVMDWFLIVCHSFLRYRGPVHKEIVKHIILQDKTAKDLIIQISS